MKITALTAAALLLQADTNKDGKLSKAEFQAACKSGLVQK
jgi:EF hand